MRAWHSLGICLLLACSDKTESKIDKTPDAGANADAAVDGGGLRSGHLKADKRFFRDELGRAVILRGVNARVEGVFDVTFDDGRVPVEDVPELTDADCKRMAELGLNLLRLPINWSGIEPQRDMFNEPYLARVDDAIACASKHGVHVLVDLHQDAYSKEIGEDGAPLWAIVPEPEMLLEGPLTADELVKRRSSRQAVAASTSFFAEGDPNDLQAEFIAMLEHVAERVADEPYVVGIDVYNEPFSNNELVADFNRRAGKAVRKVAPDLIVVFEPDVLWSRTGGLALAPSAFGISNAVYAPHLYDGKNAASAREGLLPLFKAAASEAEAFGTPWMVGEFGSGPMVEGFEAYLTAHYDLQDEYLVSSALWLWKEGNQDSWGLHDHVGNAWQEREVMVKLVSRPHAQRVAGTPSAMRFEGSTLTFEYDAALDAANVVFVPERFKVEDVTCDGSNVTPRVEGTRVEVTCKSGSSHLVKLSLSEK